MYVSRRLDYLLKCGFALFIFFFAILMTTSIGWPYHYSEGAPRLRRMIALVTFIRFFIWVVFSLKAFQILSCLSPVWLNLQF